MPDQSQADIFVQGGGVPAAGHPSNNLSVFLDFIVRPGDASPDHLKFYQQALRPRLALPDQGLLADEGWLDIRRGRGARVVPRTGRPPRSSGAKDSFSRQLRRLAAKAASEGISPKAIAQELKIRARQFSALSPSKGHS